MERYFKESMGLLQAVLDDRNLLAALERCAADIADCFARGNKLLIAGNGGSAADAQHFAAEMVGMYKLDRKALPALALTVDSSVLTAWSNDKSFDTVFARQLEAHGKAGDIFVGISTSGNSRNLVEAVKQARAMGITTICFLGKGGGVLKDACDVALVVPSGDTPHIQEVHEMFFHSICEEVERKSAASETAQAAVGAAERQPA